MVKPYIDDELRGVFATRVPSRPNSIGVSTVHLTGVEKNILYVEDLDIVDGTPLLDTKSFVPQFDVKEATSVGWLERNLHKLFSARLLQMMLFWGNPVVPKV